MGDIKVEVIKLEDGRRAERHITFDNNGNEIVEVFAEEKRPLKLEKRVVKEFKKIVARETHQTIKDGEVAYLEVKGIEPEMPLQVRERIGLIDHAKLVDGDYVRKDEVHKLIADGVVTGVTALMEHMDPVQVQREPAPQPIFNAQSIVEKNVAEKSNKDKLVIGIMVVILLAQIAFFGYLWFN